MAQLHVPIGFVSKVTAVQESGNLIGVLLQLKPLPVYVTDGGHDQIIKAPHTLP